MASFNTTVRQMTEIFRWPKCLSRKWPKYLSEKKTGLRWALFPRTGLQGVTDNYIKDEIMSFLLAC